MSEKADREAAKAEAKAHKERAKEEAKLAKFRAAFLDPASNLATRQKAFLNYCEGETDENVGPTFREHHILVLSTIRDVMNTIDINAKKGLSCCAVILLSNTTLFFFSPCFFLLFPLDKQVNISRKRNVRILWALFVRLSCILVMI